MQIDLKKETLELSELKCDLSSTLLVEGDVIVPDVKPDIREILLTEAEAHITDRSYSNGRMNIAGTVLVQILYISDEETAMPKSIETKFDFKDSLEIAEEGLSCQVKCNTEHIEFSMIHSRKLNVKVAVSLGCRGYSRRNFAVATDVAEEGALQVRKKPFQAYHIVSDISREFVMTEVIEVPQAKPDIDEIIKLEACAVKGDCRIMSGKILLKGSLKLNTLYVGLDDERCIEAMEHELAFSEMADVDGLAEDCLCHVTYELQQVYWTVKEDLNGDTRLVSLDVVLRADITASRTIEGELLEDCYSTAGQVRLTQERVRIDELLSEGVSHESLREIIELPEGMPPIGTIYSLDCKPRVSEMNVCDEKVIVKGTLIAFLLYGSTGAENAIYSLVREFDFEHSVAVDDMDENVFCECSVTSQGSSFTLNGVSELELRCVLEFYLRALRKNELQVIESCELEETQNERERHGMIIYFVQSGDTVWNIAKHYQTSQEKIIALNKLEHVTLLPGQKLLIPSV